MPNKIVPIQRMAFKAVVYNAKGKVLILREAATYAEGVHVGRYELPGGRLNPGEPFLEGLRREIREETGLQVTVGEPVFVGEWFPAIKGVPHHIVGVFFRCEAHTNNVVTSEDHDDYEWIDPAAIDRYDVIPPEPLAVRATLA